MITGTVALKFSLLDFVFIQKDKKRLLQYINAHDETRLVQYMLPLGHF